MGKLSLVRSSILAAVLFLVDAPITGSGAISLLLDAAILFVALPLLIRARARKDLPRAGQLARHAAIYGLAAVASICFNIWNDTAAVRRAGQVVEACREFQAKNHRWPATLEELTPEFLPAVPRANYTLLFGDFQYSATGGPGPPALSYVNNPPFGRWVYTLDALRPYPY
ncbi:MAG TPA: hypothetical protein VJX29_07925 [Candidatus Acidoferrales bacterium]|nr:hypothetical protein [Candidatus Acidoferrales bacterium]